MDDPERQSSLAHLLQLAAAAGAAIGLGKLYQIFMAPFFAWKQFAEARAEEVRARRIEIHNLKHAVAVHVLRLGEIAATPGLAPEHAAAIRRAGDEIAASIRVREETR